MAYEMSRNGNNISFCIKFMALSDKSFCGTGTRNSTITSIYRPHPKDGEGSFHRCVCPHRGPFQRGTPVPAGGYPSPGRGEVPQDRGNPLPSQDRTWVPPYSRHWGTPSPLRDRTAQQALATRQAVCLLRSCRRTFLFADVFTLTVGMRAAPETVHIEITT